MNILKNKKEYFILFILYSIANIFLLLNTNGIYWDDWTLINNSYKTIASQFCQASYGVGIITTNIHNTLLHIGNGIFIYRLLTFIFYFISTILLFQILKSIKELSKRDTFFITLIFMLAPLNSAKVALIDFFYGLCLMFFFLAFYLLYKNMEKNNYILRIIILLLFFASFLTNSLLVFYAIPLMYIFYISYLEEDIDFFIKVKLFLTHYLDFIILPILFFVIKVIYWKPTGLYSGYNALSLISLLKTPIGILASFYTSFIEPINVSFTLLPYFWIIIIIYILVKNYTSFTEELVQNKNDGKFLLLGILFFILGVFAYVAIGKLPNIYNFDSRHQLLVPLGFSFLLYFSIKIIASKLDLSTRNSHYIFSIFIIAFLSQNIYSGYKYKVDEFYQFGIEEQMKLNTLIQNNSTFIVDVRLDDVLANHREISFYEHNGRLKKVFGTDNRLMVNKLEDINTYKNYKSYKQYNFSSWQYSKPIYLRIEKNTNITNIYIFKMFYYQIFNKIKFKERARELVKIKELKDV